MTILKYIIGNTNIPIIFSCDIIHNTVMQKANSAGFLIVQYDKVSDKFLVVCYGNSSSLNLKSEDGDKFILENYLNNNFFSFKHIE